MLQFTASSRSIELTLASSLRRQSGAPAAGDGSRFFAAHYFLLVPKEDSIVTEGTVTQVLPGKMFRVDLSGEAQGARPYLGKDAQKFHPHRSSRQSRSGALALGFDEGADHFAREITSANRARGK